MAGLVLLVLGIALVVASPSFIKVSWEQREKPIEKTFSLLPKSLYKFEYADSYAFYISGIPEKRNLVIKGIVIEKNGNNFNFYIMDSSNKNDFWNDKPYEAYYVKRGISSDSFSVQFTLEEPEKFVHLIVENPNTNIEETITLKAKLTYEEKVTDYSTSNIAYSLGNISAIIGFLLIVSAGVAHFVLKK
jgi:hypothetical protein